MNLGFEGLLRFKRMLAYLDNADYGAAAAELESSEAVEQEPTRIYRDAAMIRSGAMP